MLCRNALAGRLAERSDLCSASDAAKEVPKGDWRLLALPTLDETRMFMRHGVR